MTANPNFTQPPIEDFQLQENTLLETPRFRVDRVVQTFRDGRIVTKEVIRHPGAVVILPILADGRICLIRNYRVAVGQWLLELPAGTLEPDEAPERTAARELVEETGYHCELLEPLCTFFMSPGILREKMHAFVARGLHLGETALEPGELIDNFVATPAEVDQLIGQQQIQDAKTIAAWLYFQRFRDA